MKKMITMIMALAMTLSLTACGGSNGSTTSTADSAVSSGAASSPASSAPASSSAASSAATSSAGTATTSSRQISDAAQTLIDAYDPSVQVKLKDPSSCEYNLKFSSENSEDNFMANSWRYWANAITDATDGKVGFTFYYDDTLIDATQEYDQLLSGIADIADAHRYASSGFNISEKWKSLTAGIPEDAVTEFSYRLWDNFPELQNEYKDVHVLAQAYSGGTKYELLTVNKEVQSPDDMKGMNIWCEADWNGFVEKCGATPVNSPFTEVYSSLQKNMYDGLMIPTETLESCKFAEVCKYCIDLNLCYATEPGHLMNLDSWNKLPADVQSVFNEMAPVVEGANEKGFQYVNSDAMAWAQKNFGTQEVKLSDDVRNQFMDLVRAANADTEKDLDAKGLPGTKIVDSLAQWTSEWKS